METEGRTGNANYEELKTQVDWMLHMRSRYEAFAARTLPKFDIRHSQTYWAWEDYQDSIVKTLHSLLEWVRHD